jgi:amino acid permease
LKRILRSSIALVTIVIAGLLYKYFAYFIAYIGFIICVPITMIFPYLAHYRLVSKSKLSKAFDIVFLIIGVIIMLGGLTMVILSNVLNINK